MPSVSGEDINFLAFKDFFIVKPQKFGEDEPILATIFRRVEKTTTNLDPWNWVHQTNVAGNCEKKNWSVDFLRKK